MARWVKKYPKCLSWLHRRLHRTDCDNERLPGVKIFNFQIKMHLLR
jgi:hypothetical protein